APRCARASPSAARRAGRGARPLRSPRGRSVGRRTRLAWSWLWRYLTGMPDSAECAHCEHFRAALAERDAALLALARERERANVIVLGQIAPARGPKPIRYWAVDAINDGLKKALPLPHAGVRAAARWLRKWRKEEP